MSIIIVHDSLERRLAAADGPIELCAEDGQVLGYFSPAKTKRLKLQPPASDDELIRRFEAGGGRPLAEILRDLEKRA